MRSGRATEAAVGRHETVLVVEDEPKIARLLLDYLKKASYGTHWLHSGSAVTSWVRDNSPDLILLDIMLPEIDGMTLCREIREFSEVPVVMVTARVDEIDRLLGLELGADDYICKPFSPREVVARVKAILRRVKATSKSNRAYFGIELDSDLYQASVNGRPLELTPVEFRLLSVLHKHPGRVFSRDQLMDNAYLDDRAVSDRTMDSHIKNLRKKLNAVLPDEEVIRTIYGVGYKLE
ncbi:MAG TPA: response regulator [Gammaproteobacteria bacterium]